MANLAAENEEDVETQVFYALSLLANASPADSTHWRQKKAVDLQLFFTAFTRSIPASRII